MDPLITNGLVTFGAAFAASSFNKAEGPGRALDDIMTLVGFEKIHEFAEKKRVKRELNIQQYKETIAQKVVKIPEENIQEPPLSIVGPALEASKFYIEEEVLRDMFANVISLSMDNRVNNKIHTAFVEIIKQLSPHDALVLQKIKASNLFVGSPYPVMKMIINESSGKKTIFPLIPLFVGDVSFEKNAISLNNLNRLGVIDIDMSTWSVNDSDYECYYSNPIIKSVIDRHPNMELAKGSFTTNNFGENFISICVE